MLPDKSGPAPSLPGTRSFEITSLIFSFSRAISHHPELTNVSAETRNHLRFIYLRFFWILFFVFWFFLITYEMGKEVERPDR